jgi:tetratricopeptide (TPR) repeat protein
MAWDIWATAEEIVLLMEAGFIYRYSGKFEEARDIFRGVRALRPASEVPEVALGGVSFDEGNFKDAINHYRKALQIDSNSAYAYVHLGEAQAFAKDKENARLSLRRAQELDPRGEHGKLARGLLRFVESVEFS